MLYAQLFTYYAKLRMAVYIPVSFGDYDPAGIVSYLLFKWCTLDVNIPTL